jgi:hypothetical protein
MQQEKPEGTLFTTGNSSALRGGVVGALVLGGIPLWTLPLLIAGKRGFLAYLRISDVYYRGAATVLGSDLFPRHEYGTVPRGITGTLSAAMMFGLIGAMLGLPSSVLRRRW